MGHLPALLLHLEQQGHVAWLETENRQFERPTKGHPVRQAVARALIALADALAPMAAGR